MPSDAAMIQAEGLTKHYGSFVAVEDLTFTIHAGEVAGFLGPNAAGKTTTMRMLTGFLSPTAGIARIGGIDVVEDRISAARKIGYLPENGPLYGDMTPDSMLGFFGKVRGLYGAGLRRAKDAVIESCGLADVVYKRIAKLSRGYRQRVCLANALLHEPDVLILDEPTSGLDPNQAREARAMLKEIGSTKTILLSTHVLQEVEAMCNRVLVIAEGRLVFDGPAGQLEEQGGAEGLDGAFRRLTRTKERPSDAPRSRHGK